MGTGESEWFVLTVDRVYKAYDGTPVLRDVSLEIHEGEVLCLLGPSGCGKTTLLRIVAGLETLDGGDLRLNGNDLTTIPVHRRRFGLMFQEFALFPHRTVTDNIAFGLRMAGTAKSAIEQRVAEMLELVNLSGYGERSIFALSGGERQRVALARSLAPNPYLLMLDEPLGSLDRALRDELITELRMILTQVNATALYVTHDQQEAFAIADRLVVMRAGQIEQIGTPLALYQQPRNAFVSRFLGLNNLVTVQVLDGDQVQTPWGTWSLSSPVSERRVGDMAELLIRPDGVQRLEPIPTETAKVYATAYAIDGTVAILSFRGATYRLEVDVPLSADTPQTTSEPSARFGFDVPIALIRPLLDQLAIGQSVRLVLDSDSFTLLASG